MRGAGEAVTLWRGGAGYNSIALMRPAASLRWIAVGVFVFSSVLNYLDRQILAAVAPLLLQEFHLSKTDYGLLLSAFSIAYAVSSPFSGYFLDRAGLNRGITIAVAFWSAATSAMGFVRGFAGLLFCRAALGVGQSGAVPAFGKLNGMYLQPKERAFGAAWQQTGLSIGGMLAPPFAVWLSLQYGWRAAFVAAGAAGLLWIPVWLWTAGRIPPTFETGSPKIPIAGMLRDRRLQALVLGNVLWMGTYTLWSNWTTLYLVQVHRQTLLQASWYAWIPPLMANAGAFLGGWLSLHAIQRGLTPAHARMRAILISAAGSLLTAAIPLTPGPGWATAGISLSYFWAASGSVNIYTLPLDLYGAERAGFAISALVFAYGVLQTFFSPAIGYLVDHQGYGPVCLLVAVMPAIAYAVIARNVIPRNVISR